MTKSVLDKLATEAFGNNYDMLSSIHQTALDNYNEFINDISDEEILTDWDFFLEDFNEFYWE